MNRFRKISLVMVAIFIAVIFYKTTASAIMSNPISKYNSINSMTSKTDLTINLSASGLSKQDQEDFEMVQSIIDDMRISTVTKMERNSNRTLNNNYMHLMMNVGGMPIDTSIWAKSDLTGKTPMVKEIVRVPNMLSDYLPTEVQGKEYAVLDMSKQKSGTLNTSKLAAASTKLMDAITNSVTTFSPGLLLIKDRGTGTLTNAEGTIKVHNYTLKLDDATFKLLMKYSVNNLAKNKDVLTALKEYVLAASSADDAEAKVLSKEIDKEIPELIKDFNDSMESLKNTKIVGKKGIVINYSVNKDGFIVNTNGVIDLVAKASTINEEVNTTNKFQSTKVSGEYNLTVKFSSNMYNINKKTKVIFPYLDKNNSFDFLKAMDEMNRSVSE